ncbi:hypothetical protein Lepto7376_1073 [[Leptolyngbya] sp. PCC 7376]|uniref:hypothetical protein n=1 Tax=[Leptolyngbya] sp. PCC 7376 TaxID=111781 RepID=UPI00029EE8A8|nr:hypothetical protein [[Leptolyngbya] sp. PCC 7376]AFY37443.1 hypothetical protein Lepto7376_1073 [[Leptolyngbya] sp. PCC 7376]
MSLSTVLEAALSKDISTSVTDQSASQELWSNGFSEIDMERLYDLCRQLNAGATLITTEI